VSPLAVARVGAYTLLMGLGLAAVRTGDALVVAGIRVEKWGRP
jgi:hypothetical protein